MFPKFENKEKEEEEEIRAQTHTQRKDHVKTQGGDSHLLAEERDLRRNQAARHFDCGLLVSGTVRNKFLIFKPAILQYLQQP